MGIKDRIHPEVGWHLCYRINDNNARDWLGDTVDPFVMFHWHFETFSAPSDARPLFRSQHCQNQAYTLGNNILAMQCHVEMTIPLITGWITKWKDDLRTGSVSEQTFDQIKDKLTEKISALNLVADSLYRRWTDTLEKS